MALRVLELFGGIGAFTQAVKSLNLPLDVVDYVEINPYSVKSYNAINDTEFEPQDITQFHAFGDKYSNIDIIMHGSPCQSFSCAGKQEGGREGSGTASSLLYETLRIVGECKPKVVIWENVPMLVSNKFKHTFMDYLRRMIAMGYRSYHKVLNAKDYGVPQNRERVFTISILGEHKPYVFPEKEVLTKRLIDLLEKNVDESYYLSDKMIEKFTWTKNGYLAAQKNKTTAADDNKPKIRRIGDLNKGGQKGEVLDSSGLCTTLSATDYKQPKQIIEPVEEDTERIIQVGNCFPSDRRDNPNQGRCYAVQGISPTLTSMNGGNRQPYVALKDENTDSRVLTEFEDDKDSLIPVRENTVKGYTGAKEYDAIDVSFVASNTRHRRVLSQMSHAVMTSGNEQVIVEPMQNDSTNQDAVECAIRNRDDGEHLEFRDDNLVSALHGNIMKSMVATPEQPKRRVRRIGMDTSTTADSDKISNSIAVTVTSQGGGLAGGSTELYAVPEDESADIKQVGWIEGNKGKTHQSGAVYDSAGVAPSQCVGKGALTRIMENGEPVIAASRGRIIGSDMSENGSKWTQQLEINDRGVCNTLSTVQKDNYVVEPTSSVRFRIRRLQPIECWRLMGFSDECFHRAEKTNSSSRLYEQSGNSIVVPCLSRILEQLLKSVEFEGLKTDEQK